MACRSRNGRYLMQLVRQQLLAVGTNAAVTSQCAQQLMALRLPASAACTQAHAFSSLTRSGKAAHQQRQLLPRMVRGFAKDSGTGAAAKPRGPVNLTSLALTAATGGALMLYYDHLMKEKLRKSELPKEATAGKPMIGGPFDLVDHHGQPFTDKDLLGNWALLYFGFTFCPDICPDELDKMAKAVDGVEKQVGAKIMPVFISLDPARDSVKQVQQYVKEFHPRMIGLTGPKEKTDAAAKAYRVYHMKTEETEDYLVDHSIIMYLVNPAGEFVQFFGKNVDAEALAKGISGHIASYKKPIYKTPAAAEA